MTKDNNGDKPGYGNPPQHSQFKPGQSGNPQGRPKGAKNKPILIPGERKFDKLWLKLVQEEVKVKGTNGVETISIIEGVFQALKIKAFKGNVSAIKFMVLMTQRADEVLAKHNEEYISDVLKFKADWQPIYDKRDWDEYNGIDVGPAPTNIRPEEFVINQETGEVTYQAYPTMKERIYFKKVENQKIKCSKRASRVLLRIVCAKNSEAADKYRDVYNARKREFGTLTEKIGGPLPDENRQVDAAHLLEFTSGQLEAYENLLVMRRARKQKINELKDAIIINPQYKAAYKK